MKMFLIINNSILFDYNLIQLILIDFLNLFYQL